MKSTAVQLQSAIDSLQAAAPATLGNSGPKTMKGKQRVALNGVTHGLTGQNIFLQESEHAAYMDLGAQYIEELRPVGVRETQLAQKIIDANWRLNTVSSVENNLFHSSLVASLHPDDPNDGPTVAMVAKATAWKTDCEGPNAFEKLGRHETRIERSLFKTTAEFERLQALRLKKGPDAFVLADCKAWVWYDRMLALHTELTNARLVAEEDQARLLQTLEQSTTSGPELVCKNPDPVDTPEFAAAASSSVKYALANGLVTPEYQEQLDGLDAEDFSPSAGIKRAA